MTIKLAPHKKCTGCMVCLESCKQNAITITKDNLGFPYPKIDSKRCIGCNHCVEICPSINYRNINKKDAIDSYAAKILDNELTKGCTSGGIVAACAKKIINMEGVVYGASYIQGLGIKHIRITDVNEIIKITGSKYVESDVSDIYESIKSDIKTGVRVLFIGTPCQASALVRLYKSKLLLTISFICGGTPSASYLKSFIKDFHVDFDSITKIVFRKGQTYCIEASTDNKILLSLKRHDNPYSKAFDEGYSVRPSCLNCNYCTRQRVEDITVGDFWGIEETEYKIKTQSNLSCVIINSQEGLELINSLDDLLSERVTINDIAKCNYRLDSKRSNEWLKTKEWLFHKLYPLFGFSKSVKYTEFLYRIPKKVKKIKNIYLKRFV